MADLIAHPSRAEILNEKGLLGRPIPAFARKVADILQGKYDQNEGIIYGKEFL